MENRGLSSCHDRRMSLPAYTMGGRSNHDGTRYWSKKSGFNEPEGCVDLDERISSHEIMLLWTATLRSDIHPAESWVDKTQCNTRLER